MPPGSARPALVYILFELLTEHDSETTGSERAQTKYIYECRTGRTRGLTTQSRLYKENFIFLEKPLHHIIPQMIQHPIQRKESQCRPCSTD